MKAKIITPAFSCYHKIITECCIIKLYLQLHFKNTSWPGCSWLNLRWFGSVAWDYTLKLAKRVQARPGVLRLWDSGPNAQAAGASLWNGRNRAARRKFAEYLGVLRLPELALLVFHLPAHQTCLNILRKTRSKTIGDCSVNNKSLASLLEPDCCS